MTSSPESFCHFQPTKLEKHPWIKEIKIVQMKIEVKLCKHIGVFKNVISIFYHLAKSNQT